MNKTSAKKLKPTGHGDTRDRILIHARRLFFNEGFASVSTDRLCHEAGVSKTSIYRHFNDMAGVFTEVIKRESKSFSVEPLPVFETREEFLSILAAFGETLLTFLNSKDILQFNRLMYTSAKVDVQMTKLFYDNGYQVGQDFVGAMINAAKERDLIESEFSSRDLADYLISMWEGLPYIRARLSLTDRPYKSPKKRARQCVDILFG